MSQDPTPNTLLAGIARADITPPVGIRSVGFASRGPLVRFHDPLSATVLVLAEGERRAALIACDLLGLDAGTVAEVRDAIEGQTGIPGPSVTVACSHTHYGPDPYRTLDDPLVSAYRANLIHTLAGSVREAASALQPVHVGVGWGTSDIGVNRREKLPDGRVILGQNPEGPIDCAVGVLRVDGVDGTPMACLVNHQTHPVSQRGAMDHISADYPGKMRELVESLTGARCLFLQGACGDINAAIMEHSYEPARTLGVRLGCEVVRVWETISVLPVTGLDVQSQPVHLPTIRYGSLEQAQALVESLRADIERLRAEGAVDALVTWAEKRLDRAQDALTSWQTGVLPEPVVSEIQAWRAGAWGLVTAPGEIFNQIGVETKDRSPLTDTFFVSCANDSIGYVPVAEAYADGGYEVERASKVDPGAARVLTEACVGLLGDLAG